MTARFARATGKEGGRLKKLLAASALAVTLAVSAHVPLAAAQTVPQGTIEAFIGTNLINVQNYPANTSVTIQVIRRGLVVGSVTGTTDAEGFTEFNHGGGGQVSEGGDCFAPPSTPDVLPGDTVRAVAGTVNNSAVVRNIGINFDAISTNVKNGTITVSGHARSMANAPIANGDVLELRLNKGSADRWDTGPGLDQDRPGRKDLRVDIGADRKANGVFTRVLRVGSQDARDWKNTPGEVSLEWSEAPPAGDEEVDPPAIFVADEAEGEALLGCPPLAEYAVKSSSPGVVNKAFIAGNAPLNLSGVAFNASRVSVTLDDRSPLTPAITRVVNLQPAEEVQNWQASFTNAQLGRLKDGMLTARATYTVNGQNLAGENATATFAGQNLNVLKDTVAPRRAPAATPKAGVYQRAISVSLKAPAGTKIHYTVNGSRPTARSREFVRPIRVTGTQTIKAVAVDKAGNAGPVGAYRYVIR